MNTEFVTLHLPSHLYEKLQKLADERQTDFTGIITQLIHQAYQQRDWLHDLFALRQQIQEDGGLRLRDSKEEIVIKLWQTRQEIFELEYAHLYR